MATWTKKDYEMVAQVLREAPLDDRLDTKDGDRDILVQAFAQRFRNDNPLFDSSRFDAAVFRGETTRKSTARHGGWTRQDYEMVADVLKNSVASDMSKAITAQLFADRFYYDNSNFKPDIFYRRALGADYKTRDFMPRRAESPFPEMERASRFAGRRPARRVRVSGYRRAR